MKAYPFAYLVTAPRFLGYSFNPVSFWYLYDKRMNLKAIILEVNNTFDERRMYFLKDCNDTAPGQAPSDRAPRPGNDNPTQNSGAQHDGARTIDEPSTRFTNSWSKDFHVSPFNSRKGSYTLSAYDPLSQGEVNNTITLSSSKGHPKLIARVFSTGASIDPTSMGTLGSLRFVAVWCWVGFVTFPRIVREAAKLFFRRRLRVWYRPEVMRGSMGRHETGDEKFVTSINDNISG